MHGFKSGTKLQHKFYCVWQEIRRRCYNHKCKRFIDYGGRDIGVCDRWIKSFENFRDDMYPSYLEHIKKFGKSNTSFDRINVNDNYEPFNCKWSTRSEQNRNTRISSHSFDRNEYCYWNNHLGSSLSKLISNKSRKSLVMEPYLGCTLLEFRQYIENQFTENMTWATYGRGGWVIDHIIPRYKFDLAIEEDRKKCFHYTNLRPLLEQQNLKDKIR
ncbi:MAG: hypothetical protein ACREBR_04435 [bacterium]